jgi:hypothetical protein
MTDRDGEGAEDDYVVGPPSDAPVWRWLDDAVVSVRKVQAASWRAERDAKAARVASHRWGRELLKRYHQERARVRELETRVWDLETAARAVVEAEAALLRTPTLGQVDTSEVAIEALARLLGVELPE